jgi:hypothetical protein
MTKKVFINAWKILNFYSMSLLNNMTNNEDKSSITLVTGLWDIGRSQLNEGWSRSFDHYLEKFKQLLQVKENLIVFGEKELESFV